MKRIAVIANRHKPLVRETVERLQKWADQHGIEAVTSVQEDNNGEPVRVMEMDSPQAAELRQKFSGCDFALTLGGDGTLLYGSHIVAPMHIPLLPINLGSLGFHTQADPANMLECMEALRAGEFRTEARLLLQVHVEGPDSAEETSRPARTIALNDIVVSRSAWGRMVHLRVYANGSPLTDLYADGLIVATPTGSSAYNYAAHGPILEPSLEALVINAICPHRTHFSPLVVSATTNITIEFHPRKPLEEAQLLVDGQPWFTATHEERLKISRAPMYLPLVVFEDNFFRRLREKLAWGGLS